MACIKLICDALQDFEAVCPICYQTRFALKSFAQRRCHLFLQSTDQIYTAVTLSREFGSNKLKEEQAVQIQAFPAGNSDLLLAKVLLAASI